MKRTLWIAARILLAAAVVVYLADWGVFRVKASHGKGYGTVRVEEYLATPLKGNKNEYDYMGMQAKPCAHSMFPHGTVPCWWLARHSSQWE